MTDPAVTRRRALQASVAGLLPATLAGCPATTNEAYGPAARLSMTPVTDADLAAKVLYTVEAGDAVAVESDGESRAALMDRIVDGGATVEYIEPPFPAGQHLLHRGTVYELSREVVERTPADLFTAEVNAVAGSGDGQKSIRIADLPAVDREKLADHGLTDEPPAGIGTTFVYTDAEQERSVLVPDPEYGVLVWDDGGRAEWVLVDAAERTMTTARYTAEAVSPAAEYGRRVRERFGLVLADLPPAQRDVVETAVAEDGYFVDHEATPSAAFAALADRFRDHEQAHALDETGQGDLSGPYVVEYGGETYWTVLVADSGALGGAPSA